jgi:hypothetical protein
VISSTIADFYRWLYYHCYRYSEKANGKFAPHWVNAACYTFVILLMNAIAVFFAIGTTFRLQFAFLRWLPDWTIYFATLGLLIAHILLHKGRYRDIIGAFSRENARETRRGDLLFGWYLVGSLFVLLAMFGLLAVLSGITPR